MKKSPKVLPLSQVTSYDDAHKRYFASEKGKATVARHLAKPGVREARNAAKRRWDQTPAGKESLRKSEAKRKGRRRLERFNLTVERYDEILAKQGGGCAICGSTKYLGVDHDHACCPRMERKPTTCCGKCVRGILCPSCNGFLGRVEKNPAILERLKEYLTWHSHC